MGFYEDLSLSNKPEIQECFDDWYKSKFGQNIQIHRFDKNEQAQRIFGTDVVIILENGIRLSIDEKLRRYNNWKTFNTYPIELESCSHPERLKMGWFYTCLAHFIVYGDVNEKEDGLYDVFMFPLTYGFKLWILKQLSENNLFIRTARGINQTRFTFLSKKKITSICGEGNCYQLIMGEDDGISTNTLG